MRSILPLAAAFLFASVDCGLAQQNVAYFPNSALTGSRNAFPWGSKGLRYQTIIPASLLGSRPQVIKDLLVTGDPTNGPLEIIYDDIEIIMGVTSVTTPTTNWATNNPNPKTVYRGPLRVRFDAGKWQGIGMPVDYLYVPLSSANNLCIEFINWKIANTTTSDNFYYPLHDTGANRAFKYQWTSNQSSPPLTSGTSGSKLGLLLADGNSVVVGVGCQGSNSQTPEIGASTYPQSNKPLDITLTGAVATRPVLLMMGTDFQKFASIPLPFDMAPLGAQGCYLWNDPTFVFPAVTDASGNAKVSLTVPGGLSPLRLYNHFWILDTTANNFGWTTSSQLKLIFGT
ncbi:MAG: hypothetical protein KDC95_17385 [Planctomycetes bacterium]|nr:hypothetical protein [Planctomycetota bacterium]